MSLAARRARRRRYDVVEGDPWSQLIGKFAKHVFKNDSSNELSSHMYYCMAIVKFSIGTGVDVYAVLVRYGVNIGICKLTRSLYDWTRLEGRTGEEVADAAANVCASSFVSGVHPAGLSPPLPSPPLPSSPSGAS